MVTMGSKKSTFQGENGNTLSSVKRHTYLSYMSSALVRLRDCLRLSLAQRSVSGRWSSSQRDDRERVVAWSSEWRRCGCRVNIYPE